MAGKILIHCFKHTFLCQKENWRKWSWINWEGRNEKEFLAIGRQIKHGCQPILIFWNFSDFNIESGFFSFLCHFLLFENLPPKRKKMKEKSHAVQFSIQVFQTGCGYFFGAHVEHRFAGWKSVKMLAWAHADDSNHQKKKKLQNFSLKY